MICRHSPLLIVSVILSILLYNTIRLDYTMRLYYNCDTWNYYIIIVIGLSPILSAVIHRTISIIANTIYTIVPAEDVRAENWCLWHLKRNSYPDEKNPMARLAVKTIWNHLFCVSLPVPNNNARKYKSAIKTNWFSMSFQETAQMYKDDKDYNDISIFFFRAYRWSKQKW